MRTIQKCFIQSSWEKLTNINGQKLDIIDVSMN